MKKLVIALVTLALVTFGAPRAARAQDVNGEGLLVGFAVFGGVVLSGAVGAGGVITGIGSAVKAGQGEVSGGWFKTAYVFGALNLVPAVAWGAVAFSNPPGADGVHLGLMPLGFMIGHVSVAALDIIAPTVGYTRGPDSARLMPIPVGGTDVAGQRWFGAGLRLSNF